MVQQVMPRTRRGVHPSGSAVLLAGAALAVLMGLLLADGGAPTALAMLAAALSFVALVGCWRMLRGDVSRPGRPGPRTRRR